MTYTVVRAFENRLADDFAKQLLTTLSTLVVAIAGEGAANAAWRVGDGISRWAEVQPWVYLL